MRTPTKRWAHGLMKILPHEEQYLKLPYDEANSLAYQNRKNEDWKKWVSVMGSGRLDGEFTLLVACAEGLDEQQREMRNEPHYMCCPKCGDGANWKMFHSVQVTSTMGVSPMCEECWHNSSPQEIESFTRGLVQSWRAECGETEATKMEEQIVSAAVGAGELDGDHYLLEGNGSKRRVCIRIEIPEGVDWKAVGRAAVGAASQSINQQLMARETLSAAVAFAVAGGI